MMKITQLSHRLIEHHIQKPGLIAIDFTCGGGEDTAFLAGFPQLQSIYSFDIQEAAISQARIRCQDDRIHYICDGHQNFDQYVDAFDIGIFNFGYFPMGDYNLTTLLETSKTAVEKALERMHRKGLLVLVVYPGHEEGRKEADYFESMCAQLDPSAYLIMKIQMTNRPTSPYILAIEKTRKAVS